MAGFGDYFNKAKDYVAFRQFLTAVTNGDSASALNYLNKKPADLDRQETISGRNALMCAASASAVGPIKLLLQKGASLRGQDKDGYTVLHMAVICGPKQMADMILQSPDIAAIINEKNRLTGMTALMYAARLPDGGALVQSLLDKGADPAMKDFQGRTALMIASENNRTQTVARLAQWKPKPKTVIRRTKPRKWGFDL